jgi:hypothetical protein
LSLKWHFAGQSHSGKNRKWSADDQNNAIDPNETFGRLALLANANTLYLSVSNGKAMKQRDSIVLLGVQL